jgi:hypothetical protein
LALQTYACTVPDCQAKELPMLAGHIVIAMLVGGLATSLALAAALPMSVAILLYPAAGSSFFLTVIAVRLGRSALEGTAVALPARVSRLR